MLLGRQIFFFLIDFPFKSTRTTKKRERHFRGNVFGCSWVNVYSKARDSLTAGSLHKIHYKARLGRHRRVVSNLYAPKETPASLNSMYRAKKILL